MLNNASSDGNQKKAGDTGISHSPLSLGNSDREPIAKPSAAVAPTLESPAQQGPATALATGRITNLKTFSTKLQPGSIKFLDESISSWLKENPDVVIKRTNVVTGDIQSKKIDPSMIITVWY